jgi:hypothetical protein
MGDVSHKVSSLADTDKFTAGGRLFPRVTVHLRYDLREPRRSLPGVMDFTLLLMGTAT